MVIYMPRLRHGGRNIPLLIHVDHQAELIADRLADGPHAVEVLPGIRFADLHLHRGEALIHIACYIFDQSFLAPIQPPAVRVIRFNLLRLMSA